MIDYKNFKVETQAALYDCGNRMRRRKMLSLLPETKGKIILEIGCGIGDFTITLEKTGSLYKKYIGLDISSLNLKTAEGLINELTKSMGRIAFVQSDVLKLPFKDNCCDIVICAEVLEHLDDMAAMREIRRILKKDGYNLITVPYLGKPVEQWGHLRHYDLQTLKVLAEKSGFAIEKINIFGRFHKISWVKTKQLLYQLWGVWRKITGIETDYYSSRFHRCFIMPIMDKFLFLDDLFSQPKTAIGSKGYVAVLLRNIAL
jgi:ubiquinone/menaquinone biosynthesis C-methylase UbiE